MAIHIGKIIHEFVKKRGYKAKSVAKAINISESSVYKIYGRNSIDIDKLIKLSQFLDTNLFVYYLRQEPLKSMVNQESEKLVAELNQTKVLLTQKEKRVKELEDINSSQQKIIALLEKTSPISKNKGKR